MIARSVLGGEPGAPRDVVLLNAGTGAYVAGLVGSIEEGVQKAPRCLTAAPRDPSWRISALHRRS